MKNSTKKHLFAISGLALVLVTIYQAFTEPNYGFAPSWSAEDLGFNIAHVGFAILGFWLIYKGFKK